MLLIILHDKHLILILIELVIFRVIHKEVLFFWPNMDYFTSLIHKKESDDPPIPPGAIKFSYSTHVSELRLKLCDAEFEFLEFKVHKY